MQPFTSLQRGMLGVRRPGAPVALKDSVTLGKGSGLNDVGLFMSRSFRVGWGPGWLLTHSGDQIGGPPSTRESNQQPNNRTKTLSDGGVYKVCVERVGSLTWGKEEQVNEEPLRISLSHSEVEFPDGAACPLVRPRRGVEALHQYNLWISALMENHRRDPLLSSWCDVWTLVEALWGHLRPSDQQLDPTPTPLGQYQEQLARRRRFSDWLANGAQRKLRVEEEGKSRRHGAEKIFSLLTANRISDACVLARSIEDHRLSLLLSQAMGGQTNRDLLALQLADWSRMQADCFMSEERLRIFTLLAGKPVWQSTEQTVNVCSELDWRRCVAVHLWFMLPPTASVSDALNSYEAAFQGTGEAGRYTCAPLPPYQEESGDEKRHVYDLCFHLLKLYSDRHYPLERLLDPLGVSSDLLDYRLSWNLWVVLESLCYSHLSVQKQCLLHSSYAALLESRGHWHLAVLVLLHIPDHTVRERAVRETLSLHCEEEGQRETFLKEELSIPAQWLEEAKAIRARSLNQADREAHHLYHAGLWNQCHKLLIHTLASDCIVNGNHDFLLVFLEGLSEPDRCGFIQDWDSAGRVYLDYIRTIRLVSGVQQANISAYQLECLFSEVKSLCQKIELLPCRSAKDRVAQSEMAKRVANMLRVVLTLQSDGGAEEQLRPLAPPLTRLPMQEDYALEELHSLTQSYLTQLIGGQ